VRWTLPPRHHRGDDINHNDILLIDAAHDLLAKYRRADYPDYLAAVKRVYDAASAVLITADVAADADLRKLRDAYIDAHARYFVADNDYRTVHSAANALRAALNRDR
jgi:hypothetical protein